MNPTNPLFDKGELIDITCGQTGDIEIIIKNDGKVLWINGPGSCLVRICRIDGNITIRDERKLSDRPEDSCCWHDPFFGLDK
jgi:ethanolamine utilization protein EutA (predicted chaperonin)